MKLEVVITALLVVSAGLVIWSVTTANHFFVG